MILNILKVFIVCVCVCVCGMVILMFTEFWH